MDGMIIAIDPGREKCGIAVIGQDQGVVMQGVVATGKLVTVVKELLVKHGVRVIVLGDGTSSHEAKEKLAQLQIDEKTIPVILIDERHSTDQARKRYWQEHPPTGFMRFVPVTMQVPPRPVDDYVAVILAERYFDKI